MIKQNFFATSNVSHYTLFTLCFQMGMAISLAAMPIYFKNQDAVSAYGMAYSAMAITGTFSFIYGIFIDKVGFFKALIIGVILYGIALSMRVFTHPLIAVLTAIVAGAGASIAILANRSWVLDISETSTQNTTELTAMRSILINASMLFGTALVSFLVFLFDDIYMYLLLLAGLLVFVANIFSCRAYKKNKQTSPHKTTAKNNTITNNLTIPALLFIFSDFIAGVYTGLFKPYLILMFVDYGLSESMSVFVFLLTTFVSVIAGIVLLKYNHIFKHISFLGFCVSMIGLFGVYVLMSLILNIKMGFYLLVAMALFRSVFLSLSSSFEQVLQYELLNKATLGMVLGFTQTAFLAGDALGSLVTSLWVIPKDNADYAQICLYCAILALVQVVVVFVLKQLARKTYNN